jgi:hypothetical protein
VQARGDGEPSNLNTLCHATPSSCLTVTDPCSLFRILEVFVSILEN